VPISKKIHDPASLDCILIADDLTGACDSAVHFAIRGLPAEVLHVRDAQATGARVLAISTGSRDCEAPEIQAAMALAAAQFPVASGVLVFKKIDSTLRGNPGIELAAALDALRCDAAVVCAAFPKMHRVVEQGLLRVLSAPDFVPIDVAALLELQSGERCTHVRREALGDILSGGARILTVDAGTDHDLDAIAEAILPMGRRILWAGSAGLAAALARCLDRDRATSPEPVATGPALFCIGSDHGVTIAQQAALLDARPSVLLLAPAASSALLRSVLARGAHAVLRVPRGKVELGYLRELLADLPAAALVLSGGDTASLICTAAGVRRIA
jgi:uncharacterized protein YgbK (DUF1537 family)